jgi:hypothetical protein
VTEEGEIQLDNVLHDLASLPKPLAQGLGDTRDLCMNRLLSTSPIQENCDKYL